MRCRGCDGALERVFEMDPMPLAAGFTETRDAALVAETYPLAWEWCTRCGLVNVVPDVPNELLYSAYRYSSSQVPGLVRHHAEYAHWLASRHGAGIRLVEIGSNDGVLLRQLPASWDVTGVDPSDVPSEGIRRLHQPFSSALARSLGKFDVVTSSNSFAHFTGIEDAIEGVAACLKADGTAYIEVHDLAATLRLAQWDTIYHEHCVEWSIDSLFIAFARHGLALVESFGLPLHGGLIRAVFRRSKVHDGYVPLRPNFDWLVRAYRTRQAPDLPGGWWAYGAAARATVYLNQMDLTPESIADGSPRRQGWYVPGVGTRIATPEEFDKADPPAALVTAWNHAPDIKARHPDYDKWVSAW